MAKNRVLHLQRSANYRGVSYRGLAVQQTITGKWINGHVQPLARPKVFRARGVQINFKSRIFHSCATRSQKNTRAELLLVHYVVAQKLVDFEGPFELESHLK